VNGALSPQSLCPLAWEELSGFKDIPVMVFLERWKALKRQRNNASLPSPSPWREALEDALSQTLQNLPETAQNEAEVRDWLMSQFLPYQVSTQALITGYFEPEHKASEKREGPYQYPLYSLPPSADLNLTRAQIEAGALEGKGLEFAYMADPFALFFIHIQGSARLRLSDGAFVRIGFAGKNHHPYHAIGRDLLESGAIEQKDMSMQAILSWLQAAPKEEAFALLARNPSYIFFEKKQGLRDEDGPVGAAQVPLQALQSIAIDPAHWPFGLLFMLSLKDGPSPQLNRPLLTMALDQGSAIKGMARADLYCGAGEKAGACAGGLKHQADMVVFLPRGAVSRQEGTL
jgi:membrane-bound lytic murein transglycosylase A